MVKEFGCEQCGHIIKAVPPDDAHSVFLINKIKDDCIKITYNCDECHNEVVRYWCTRDPLRIIGVGLKDPYDY